MRIRWRWVFLGGGVILALALAAALAAWQAYRSFRPVAITLGPETTLYFQSDPPLTTRVHEAIHRRQMREKSLPGRIVSAFRYNFDYDYRLDEEAEARAGEICLQIHRFSSQLPAYTASRSWSQAHAYRAWTWERMGMEVPDRVGERIRGGEGCGEILRGAELDLPLDAVLTSEEELRLAAFHFLRSYGSRPDDVNEWKARLRLVGFARPAPWDFRSEMEALSRIPDSEVEALPPVDSISPRAAGEALHRLTFYGVTSLPVGVRRVSVAYRGWPILDPGTLRGELGVRPEEWPARLLPRALAGNLGSDQVAWLGRMASHPAHRDFETFARAPSADIAGARYRMPFPSGMTWDRLPPPEIEALQEAFLAQWGRAALAADREDWDEAERILRTVVSASLQLLRNGPLEVEAVQALSFLPAALGSLAEVRLARPDSLAERVDDPESGPDGRGAMAGGSVEAGDEVGTVSARSGASGGTGARGPGPEELEGGAAGSRAWWERNARTNLLSTEPAALYRALPYLVVDGTIPYAFRLLGYRQVVLYDVCLDRRESPEAAVWRGRIEEGLVRRPSDRALLELVRGRVESLLEASRVPPAALCSEEEIARPRARLAIMGLPPALVPQVGYGDR